MLFGTCDQKEGIHTFLEKRSPQFIGAETASLIIRWRREDSACALRTKWPW